MASVTNKPWNGSAARFTDQQWARACVLDRGPGIKGKARYLLPIREPDGTLNSVGVGAAAGRLNQTEAPPEAKADARRRLVSAYRQIGKPTPPGLSVSEQAAGPAGMTARDGQFVHDMLQRHQRIAQVAHEHRARGGHPDVQRFADAIVGHANDAMRTAAHLAPGSDSTPARDSLY